MKYLAEREDGRICIVGDEEVDAAAHNSGSNYRSWEPYTGPVEIGAELGFEGYLTTAEVARLWGKEESGVRRNVLRKALRAEKIGKTWLVPAGTAADFYEKNE